MKVIPEMHFGCLTTRWSWKNHSCRKVWKCTCKCGGYCYVKEDALTEIMEEPGRRGCGVPIDYVLLRIQDIRL